jgi:hypothetical protein
VEDDEVDACSGALEMLNPRTKSWGMFEVTRQIGAGCAQILLPGKGERPTIALSRRASGDVG